MGKLLISFLLITGALASIVYLLSKEGAAPTSAAGDSKLTRMYLGNLPLKVEVVSSDAARRKGLSDRISLESDQGMLFVFDRPQKLQFWMKDMHFPIDIIWLDENYTVVDITKDARPESYPDIFSPKIPSQYVLEVNAGLTDSFAIEPGTKLTFTKNFLTN